MIALILNEAQEQLQLSCYYGESMSSARMFYRQNLDFYTLREEGWQISSNFHFAFVNSNLIWIEAPEDVPVEDYVNYWQNHPNQIRQLKRDEVVDYIRELEQNQIISMTNETWQEYQRAFDDTRRSTLNPCPGLGALYFIPMSDAESLDRRGEFEGKIRGLITQALAVINRTPGFLSTNNNFSNE